MLFAFGGMATLGDLRANTVPFLALYSLGWIAYAHALNRSRSAPTETWDLALWFGMAILFRVALLATTPPTLSDDVYRYIWDGHLIRHGVSPYEHAVNSPLLDALATPLRALVNHNWMASPYLPVAQAYSAIVSLLSPGNPLGFQIAAALFDLGTGLLILDLLRRLGLPRSNVLIYLWNPLVIVEFAHGAHLDALMLLGVMLAFRALAARRSRVASAIALAAATLTKGLPGLLAPLLARRWGWRALAVYGTLVLAPIAIMALGPGLGLTGPPDGTGVFGALRIYLAQWNYNGSVYHWLEVWLSGYRTSGGVPSEVVGIAPIAAAKAITGVLLLAAVAAGWAMARRNSGLLALLRTALIPLAAYLLLTATVHPWYVTLIVPLLPFLAGPSGQATAWERLLWPLLYLTGSVALSYLTYLDPANPREYGLVRLLEYVPVYAGLAWAAWRAIASARAPGRVPGPPRIQSQPRT